MGVSRIAIEEEELGRREGREIGRGGYDFDGAVPRAGAKRIFADEIPVHGEDFSLMLLPGLHWEFIERGVEELDGAVAGGDYELVLMRFGPGEVVEGVLGIEPFAMISPGAGFGFYCSGRKEKWGRITISRPRFR